MDDRLDGGAGLETWKKWTLSGTRRKNKNHSDSFRESISSLGTFPVLLRTFHVASSRQTDEIIEHY